jgi:hypothetical protein
MTDRHKPGRFDDIPQLVREKLLVLFDEDDVGAIWTSPDGMRVTVQTYVGSETSSQTYVYDPEAGCYELAGYNSLRRAKSEGGWDT